MTLLNLALITPPATEPITLTEAKAHVRVTASTEDTLLTALIVAARQFVEEETSRALITQTWERQLDDWPAFVRLPRPPALAITSIKYVDEDGTEATLASTAYTLYANVEPGHLVIDGDELPTGVVLADYAGVRIRYTAGYGAAAAVPQALKQAMLLLIGHWYLNREAVAIGGQRSSMTPLPLGVDALIAPYRLMWMAEW